MAGNNLKATTGGVGGGRRSSRLGRIVAAPLGVATSLRSRWEARQRRRRMQYGGGGGRKARSGTADGSGMLLDDFDDNCYHTGFFDLHSDKQPLIAQSSDDDEGQLLSGYSSS